MLGKRPARERRRAARTHSDSISVTIHEIDSARSTVTRGVVTNVSDRGMGVLTRERIPERTYVTLRSEPWDWSGAGSARHCTPVKAQYLVGVELSTTPPKPSK